MFFYSTVFPQYWFAVILIEFNDDIFVALGARVVVVKIIGFVVTKIGSVSG